MVEITIPYPPVTKKNHGILVKGRSVILPSKPYMKFKRWAVGTKTLPGYLLRNYGNIQVKDPCFMIVQYWLKDRRIPDVSNLISATADILEEAGIVKNDKLIFNVHGTIAGIDKENPRTELTIILQTPNWWTK